LELLTQNVALARDYYSTFFHYQWISFSVAIRSVKIKHPINALNSTIGNALKRILLIGRSFCIVVTNTMTIGRL